MLISELKKMSDEEIDAYFAAMPEPYAGRPPVLDLNAEPIDKIIADFAKREISFSAEEHKALQSDLLALEYGR